LNSQPKCRTDRDAICDLLYHAGRELRIEAVAEVLSRAMPLDASSHVSSVTWPGEEVSDYFLRSLYFFLQSFSPT